MQNTTVNMLKTRIELLTARPKDNQKIINKLVRRVRKMEKEGR